jgi:hypothetical protein
MYTMIIFNIKLQQLKFWFRHNIHSSLAHVLRIIIFWKKKEQQLCSYVT